MDLSTIKPTTQTVEILHPATKEPIGLRIELVSLEDDKMKATIRANKNKALARDKSGRTLKAEEFEATSNETVLKAMQSWEWYAPEGSESATNWRGDESPAMNLKVVTEIFDELPWIKDQLMEKLSETESFFESSKTT